MKWLLLPIVIILAGCLAGCTATDAAGKATLSPEMRAALDRMGVSVITAAEEVATAKVRQSLKVTPAK